MSSTSGASIEHDRDVVTRPLRVRPSEDLRLPEGPLPGAADALKRESMLEVLLAIEGIVEAPSRFADRPALWANGTEIAHFDDEVTLDIRLTRQVIRARRGELRDNPSITLRPSSSADWLEIRISGISEEALAIELVVEAAKANGARRR
jgi:hypothetical protein